MIKEVAPTTDNGFVSHENNGLFLSQGIIREGNGKPNALHVAVTYPLQLAYKRFWNV
jgi:hypothetical protein